MPDVEVIWQCRSPKQSRPCVISSVLVRKFAREGVRDLNEETWLQHVFEGRSKKIIEYCKNKHGILCYLRAIQGTSGGNSN